MYLVARLLRDSLLGERTRQALLLGRIHPLSDLTGDTSLEQTARRVLRLAPEAPREVVRRLYLHSGIFEYNTSFFYWMIEASICALTWPGPSCHEVQRRLFRRRRCKLDYFSPFIDCLLQEGIAGKASDSDPFAGGGVRYSLISFVLGEFVDFCVDRGRFAAETRARFHGAIRKFFPFAIIRDTVKGKLQGRKGMHYKGECHHHDPYMQALMRGFPEHCVGWDSDEDACACRH